MTADIIPFGITREQPTEGFPHAHSHLLLCHDPHLDAKVSVTLDLNKSTTLLACLEMCLGGGRAHSQSATQLPRACRLKEDLKQSQSLASCAGLSVQSPLKAALTGLELLLARAQVWEESAAKHVSLARQLEAVAALATRWRKLELAAWRNLLKTTRSRHAAGKLLTDGRCSLRHTHSSQSIYISRQPHSPLASTAGGACSLQWRVNQTACMDAEF